MDVSTAAQIALIGFGEAAEAFVTGWGPGRASEARAYDIKLLQGVGAGVLARAVERGISCHAAPAEALSGVNAAFCLVTADQALAAAEACAPHLAPELLWLDGNSCAPGTKRRAAAVIEAAGGRYVDMAIMAPVHPRLHQTPALLAGPQARAAETELAGLDMNGGSRATGSATPRRSSCCGRRW